MRHAYRKREPQAILAILSMHTMNEACILQSFLSMHTRNEACIQGMKHAYRNLGVQQPVLAILNMHTMN